MLCRFTLSHIIQKLKLSLMLRDVVSAGVHECAMGERINPKKLGRLFKANDLLPHYFQHNQRILTAEDVIEYEHILVVDVAVGPETPYEAWNAENEYEPKTLLAEEPATWKNHFKAHIAYLRTFDQDPAKRGTPILDFSPDAKGRCEESDKSDKVGHSV